MVQLPMPNVAYYTGDYNFQCYFRRFGQIHFRKMRSTLMEVKLLRGGTISPCALSVRYLSGADVDK